MRRIAVCSFLVLLALAWLAPAVTASGASGRGSYKPVAESKKHTGNHKKAPAPPAHHKTKKHKSKHPAPRPTSKPRRTATPKPRSTATPPSAPVNTPVPTATATTVPTPTQTPTPVPLTATLGLKSAVPQGYSAGFYVCGLPSGATASFAPNPSTSKADNSSSTYGSAQTVATISVPYTVSSNSYGLTFYAYYRDGRGAVVRAPPGGNVTPQFAVLTVQRGSVSLLAADAVPADGGQGCSAPPTGYQPTPQPTLGETDYTLTTWVSDAHPVTGETITVYAQLTQAGRAISGATVNFSWYSYGVTRAPCSRTTDGTGTASCSLVNSYPLSGVPVTIEATVLYDGLTFNGWTSYTM